jgi:hypothetical protein
MSGVLTTFVHRVVRRGGRGRGGVLLVRYVGMMAVVGRNFALFSTATVVVGPAVRAGLGHHGLRVARGGSSRPYGPWDNGRDVEAAHDCGTGPTMRALMTTGASADARPAAQWLAQLCPICSFVAVPRDEGTGD